MYAFADYSQFPWKHEEKLLVIKVQIIYCGG